MMSCDTCCAELPFTLGEYLGTPSDSKFDKFKKQIRV